jgi:hypothetical protein
MGYSFKKRGVDEGTTEQLIQEQGDKDDLRMNELQRLQQRQASDNTSTDCFFYVVENNSTGNYSIYSINLSTLSQGQTIDFNTSSFVPGPNTTVTYIEQCPAGVPFPQLNVSNLVFVTAPVSATSISSTSSTTASNGASGCVNTSWTHGRRKAGPIFTEP